LSYNTRYDICKSNSTVTLKFLEAPLVLAKVLSSAVIGIDAYIVQVEVDISEGLPAFSTVGLPEGAVRESKERVKAAIKNSGYDFPADRITVNLAPADVKKEGSAFDLPIALGILAATGLITENAYAKCLFLGELALDGLLRPVRGVLPMAIYAKSLGFKGVYLPPENAPEAAVVGGIDIFPTKSLASLVQTMNGRSSIDPFQMEQHSILRGTNYDVDFRDVRGQENAKRAIEIAAAGGHNMIMIGPPGSGKTMLARRLPTILPSLTFEESLGTSKIYSVMGLMPNACGLISIRPFRSPHHTISDAGLIGGGQNPKPGEVSLAHNGVLFLDELPEFRKNVLEVLRQPMEDGKVTISRASTSVTYPSQFILVAAMNPCPCGFLGDPKRDCSCSFLQIRRYRAKISGPLLDRIDIHMEVPPVAYKDLSSESDGASSYDLFRRVVKAREIQRRRFTNTPIQYNARMGSRHLRRFCRIKPDAAELLEKAMGTFGLSARAHARILKISRTIADLEHSPEMQTAHVAEAIQYRALDRSVAR
jgi:magnesium chelatase family protein